RSKRDWSSDVCSSDLFELTPVDDGLPRVAYVFQLHSHQRPTVPGEGLLYGDNCRHLLPTILHPNEVLDGAVMRAYDSMAMETWRSEERRVGKERSAGG